MVERQRRGAGLGLDGPAAAPCPARAPPSPRGGAGWGSAGHPPAKARPARLNFAEFLAVYTRAPARVQTARNRPIAKDSLFDPPSGARAGPAASWPVRAQGALPAPDNPAVCITTP